MKTFKRFKLNQTGFNHHMLLPLVVIVVVAAVGVRLLRPSKAEAPGEFRPLSVSFEQAHYCDVPYPTLHYGDHHKCVLGLQHELSQAGLLKGDVKYSENFGPKTLAAIQAVQIYNGLPGSGIVDSLTWEKLGRLSWQDYADKLSGGGYDRDTSLFCQDFTVDGRSKYSGSLSRWKTYRFGVKLKNSGTTTWHAAQMRLQAVGEAGGPVHEYFPNPGTTTDRTSVTPGQSLNLTIKASFKKVQQYPGPVNAKLPAGRYYVTLEPTVYGPKGTAFDYCSRFLTIK